MSLFRKIFGSKSDHSEDEFQSDNRGKYMPDVKPPIDERFTINFKANGGKFLYCENLDEIFDCLQQIIDENNWHDSSVLLLDDNLKDRFSKSQLKTTKTISEAVYSYYLRKPYC